MIDRPQLSVPKRIVRGDAAVLAAHRRAIRLPTPRPMTSPPAKMCDTFVRRATKPSQLGA